MGTRTPFDNETLEELAVVAGELLTSAELVSRFVAACLREWCRNSPVDNSPPAAMTLQPLLELVSSKMLDNVEDDKIRRTCLLSLTGEHLEAQKAYIDLVIGSVKWP